MKELEGKRIEAVLISDDQMYLKFLTNDGEFIYYTDGDCCSETWINHISGSEVLVGQEIQSVEDVELESIEADHPLFSGKQDVDRLYSTKLFTNKGVCDIDYRNASNGYYGGALYKVSSAEKDTKFQPLADF